MPVSSKKAPKKTQSRSTEPETDTKSEGAWKYENGVKVRNGRLLTGESKLKEILYDLGETISNGDAFVGEAIKNQAPELAYGYCRLAQEDATVKRIIGYLTSSSAYAEALIPTVTLAAAILWHFGIFVPDKIGVPAAILTVGVPMSREVETEMKRQEQESRRHRNGNAAGDTKGSGTGKSKAEESDADDRS